MATASSASPADRRARYEPNGLGNVDSYRLAFDESVRTLELLDKRTERLQTSYVTVLAFIGAGIAFLAGNVLTNSQRTTDVRVLSVFATAAFAAAFVLAIWDLWPRRRPGGVDAEMIVEQYVETQIPASYELTLASLATYNAEAADRLRLGLKRMSIRFAVFLAMAGASTVLWILTAWVADLPTSS